MISDNPSDAWVRNLDEEATLAVEAQFPGSLERTIERHQRPTLSGDKSTLELLRERMAMAKGHVIAPATPATQAQSLEAKIDRLLALLDRE